MLPALLRALVPAGGLGFRVDRRTTRSIKFLTVFAPDLAKSPAIEALESRLRSSCAFLFSGASTCGSFTRGFTRFVCCFRSRRRCSSRSGLVLLWWAYRSAGVRPILSQPSAFADGQPKAGQFFAHFVPALTGMIGSGRRSRSH